MSIAIGTPAVAIGTPAAAVKQPLPPGFAPHPHLPPRSPLGAGALVILDLDAHHSRLIVVPTQREGRSRRAARVITKRDRVRPYLEGGEGDALSPGHRHGRGRDVGDGGADLLEGRSSGCRACRRSSQVMGRRRLGVGGGPHRALVADALETAGLGANLLVGRRLAFILGSRQPLAVGLHLHPEPHVEAHFVQRPVVIVLLFFIVAVVVAIVILGLADAAKYIPSRRRRRVSRPAGLGRAGEGRGTRQGLVAVLGVVVAVVVGDRSGGQRPKWAG
mmetsp:Transcript_59913/g.177642  ORF Transcript_59913/g.177642 Transcript_59913/m.177642 type:complete len:275 (+) Transcript_59913:533-1357(+)